MRLTNPASTIPAPAPHAAQVEQDRSDTLIEVRGLTKQFGSGSGAVFALNDVSLAIARNEFFTLLGPSGCGKTTLLRLLAGFEHPSDGQILLDGLDLTVDPPNLRPINTVFQSYALFPHMTVGENIRFGLERLGRSAAEIDARVAHMLRLVRLADYAGRRPSQLSGGQQQRVALARALAPGPRLLLLDEPLSVLDLKLRREMQTELKRLQRETGITFVLVTHDQEEALSMSDRIAVMSGGRVLQIGSPLEIYDRPVSRFVADFIGEANIIPGALVGSAAAHVAIRPERMTITKAEGAASGIMATVTEITFLGGRVVYDVRVDDTLALTVVAVEPVEGIATADVVSCRYDPHHVRPLED